MGMMVNLGLITRSRFYKICKRAVLYSIWIFTVEQSKQWYVLVARFIYVSC